MIRLIPLLLVAVLLSAQPPAQPKAQNLPLGGNLGRVWRVRDWAKPSFDFKGAWSRRGNSLEFDIDYTDTIKGHEGRKAVDRVRLISIKGDQVVLQMSSSQRSYVGTIQVDGKTIKGRGDWCRGFDVCGWEAVADWEVNDQLLASISGKPRFSAAAKNGASTKASLGNRWRVRDNTSPGFAYSGVWTFQPGTESIRFEYKDAVSGQSASGSLIFTGVTGDKVAIYNPGRQKSYRGTIQADGKTIKGTADWCQNRSNCFWEAAIETEKKPADDSRNLAPKRPAR